MTALRLGQKITLSLPRWLMVSVRQLELNLEVALEEAAERPETADVLVCGRSLKVSWPGWSSAIASELRAIF